MRESEARRVIRATSWPAISLPLNGVAAPALLISGAVLLRGWAVVCTAGSATDVSLRDGVDSTGQFAAYIHLVSAGTSVLALPGAGVHCEIGVYLDTLNQALKGAVWVTPLTGPFADQCDHDALAYEQAGPHGPRGV